MARTKQTPRKSTGGRASIKQLATKVARSMTFAAIALARPTLTSGSTSSGSTSSGSTFSRSISPRSTSISRSASFDSVVSHTPSWGESPSESPPGSPNPQILSVIETVGGDCHEIGQNSYRCSLCTSIHFDNSHCDGRCHQSLEITQHAEGETTYTYFGACP